MSNYQLLIDLLLIQKAVALVLLDCGNGFWL
jgi:hypothetical protein